MCKDQPNCHRGAILTERMPHKNSRCKEEASAGEEVDAGRRSTRGGGRRVEKAGAEGGGRHREEDGGVEVGGGYNQFGLKIVSN